MQETQERNHILSAWTVDMRRTVIPLLGFDPWQEHNRGGFPVPIEKDPWFHMNRSIYEHVVPLDLPVAAWVAKQWLWSRVSGAVLERGPWDVRIVPIPYRADSGDMGQQWAAVCGTVAFYFQVEARDSVTALEAMCRESLASTFKPSRTPPRLPYAPRAGRKLHECAFCTSRQINTRIVAVGFDELACWRHVKELEHYADWALRGANRMHSSADVGPRKKGGVSALDFQAMTEAHHQEWLRIHQGGS
jgi:hypothetical protein